MPSHSEALTVELDRLGSLFCPQMNTYTVKCFTTGFTKNPHFTVRRVIFDGCVTRSYLWKDHPSAQFCDRFLLTLKLWSCCLLSLSYKCFVPLGGIPVGRPPVPVRTCCLATLAWRPRLRQRPTVSSPMQGPSSQEKPSQVPRLQLHPPLCLVLPWKGRSSSKNVAT